MVKSATKKTLKEKTKKFYITTPIYYPNDIPHIGHAYTTIAADILARWHKLVGEEVFFLTGTDEHGKKIEQTAAKVDKKPKEFIDALIPEFKSAWNKLNINYDRFIRTTDKDHEKTVQAILQKVYDKGDIYLDDYTGLYCTACEAYYTEKDLVNDCCPIHKKPIEILREKSYFFKLSKYQDKLLKFYKENPNFILPKFRANEVKARVKECLNDLSISRTSFDWGITLPFDKKHICYVWFDALFNYVSGVGYLEDKKKFEKFWPADVQLIGKDILWFHCVYWPAFLLSAGIELPKTIFAHGWWTFDNEKISKSRGKVINIDELVSIAGTDAARYFLFRGAVFGQDGDFSRQVLIERHNNELADKLGNLVSRVSTLAEKYGVKKCENKLLGKLKLKEIEKLIENYEIDKALNEIFAFVDRVNEFVQAEKPWETKDSKVLYQCVDSIKAIAILLFPFIPETSEKIAKNFGFEIKYENILENLEYKNIKKSEILFKKIEVKEDNVEEKLNKPKQTTKIEGIANMTDVIKYDDFAKLDLRVGTIKKVEDIEGADKLYKLEVDVGEAKTRVICAGIKKFYSKDELKGKQIIVICNLEPRKMRGIESNGMLLAASTADDSKVILLSPEKKIDSGSKVR